MIGLAVACTVVGFFVGVVLGMKFRSQTDHMKGFDEGFRAGKDSIILQHKLANASLYRKFYDGRKNDIQ